MLARVSAALADWCLLDISELLGHEYQTVLPKLFGTAHAPEIGEKIRAAFHGGCPQWEGSSLFGAEKRDFHVSFTPHKEDGVDGKLHGVVIMVNDLTNLHSAERVALTAKRRLRMATEATRTGIWETDLRTGQMYWDEVCYSVLAWQPDSRPLSWDNFANHIHPDDREHRATTWATALINRKPYECEYRIVLGDGSIRWILTRGRFMQDQNGVPTRAIGIVFEITQLRIAEEKAAREAKRSNEILESTTDCVIMVDRAWIVTYLNSNTEKTFSAFHPIMGRKLAEIFPQEEGTLFTVNFQRTMDDRVPTTFEEFYPAPLNRWFEVHTYPSEEGAIGFLRDVTERHEAAALLRLHQQAIEAVPVGISISEYSAAKDYPLVYVNPAFERITGYRTNEVLGDNCRFLQSKDRKQPGRRKLRTAVEAGMPEKAILQNYRKNGTLFFNEVQISPVRNERGEITHFLGIQADITNDLAAKQQLTRQANYDALTDIPNRYFFLSQLRHAMHAASENGKELALIYLDLDNLKIINESLGHTQGDQLLKEVAARIAASAPEGSTFGRWGGDEFLLFCTNPEIIAHIDSFLERLIADVSASLNLNNREVEVTVSAGCSFFPKDAGDADELLRTADLAMYVAKREGKRVWRLYRPSMDSGQKQRLDIAARLKRALSQKEFVLWYQPRIDARTNRLTSLEALIRWHHPERGIVSPGEFIPVAEEIGLITAIGKWVIEEAISQSIRWQNSGFPPVPVSVNVSPSQLRQPGFVESVMDCLNRHGLPPRMLEMELTESMLMDDTVPSQSLNELREHGVLIAIDDFGTGYSALSYLARFPIDTLKIDRAFTLPVTESPKSAAICRSVIRLAAKLGFRTVAEGIEFEDQAKLLRNWGCDEMQGYFFARPMAADEITKRIDPSTRLIRP